MLLQAASNQRNWSLLGRPMSISRHFTADDDDEGRTNETQNIENIQNGTKNHTDEII